MEGALRSTSLMKRVAAAIFPLLPYSARYVAASTPTGAPMRMPSTVSTKLPKMAFNRPPELPGGVVVSVNILMLRPSTPMRSKVHKIQARMKMPSAVASTDAVMFHRLTPRRRKYRLIIASPSHLAGELAQHQPGEDQNHEGDEE